MWPSQTDLRELALRSLTACGASPTLDGRASPARSTVTPLWLIGVAFAALAEYLLIRRRSCWSSDSGRITPCGHRVGSGGRGGDVCAGPLCPARGSRHFHRAELNRHLLWGVAAGDGDRFQILRWWPVAENGRCAEQ